MMEELLPLNSILHTSQQDRTEIENQPLKPGYIKNENMLYDMVTIR